MLNATFDNSFDLAFTSSLYYGPMCVWVANVDDGFSIPLPCETKNDVQTSCCLTLACAQVPCINAANVAACMNFCSSPVAFAQDYRQDLQGMCLAAAMPFGLALPGA